MEQYLPLVTLLVLAILFCVVSAAVSRLVSPKAPTQAKSAPYECGIIPSQEPPERFGVRFYLVAMLFIIFDIEIVFLYPYAVLHGELGTYGVWAIAVFSVPLLASYLYEIGEGGLEWGPAKRMQPLADSGIVSALRTSRTTIRRVGLEGREPAA
jgi:NADH-quinone oxidoreductase subunit A